MFCAGAIPLTLRPDKGSTTLMVDRFELTERGLSHRELFACWRAALAGVFDVGATPGQIENFVGDFAAYATRQFVVSEGASSSVRLVRSSEAVARSGLDQFALRLFQSGYVTGEAGDAPFEAQAGDICFFDLSQTVSLQLSAQGGMTGDVTIWIHRQRLLSSFSNENALHGMVLSGASSAGSVIGATLRSFAENVSRMNQDDMDALASGLIELVAKAVARLLEHGEGRTIGAPLASFVSTRRFIDRNLTSAALNADMVAGAFGLSRASLYRLFEPVGGIAKYIRKARLNRAYQEIVAAEIANRRIGQIAYRLGFKNVSAFNRLFQETYGVSPSEARKRALQGLAGVRIKSEVGGKGELGNLLAQLGK